MEKYLIVFLIVVFSTWVISLPLSSNTDEKDGPKTGDDKGEYGDYFEGDMILNKHQKSALSSARNGLINIDYRWPNKTVPYQLHPNHTTQQNAYILVALSILEDVSCIKFRPRTNEGAYVQLQPNGGGCYSSVGYQNRMQIINLKNSYEPGEGCFRLGTIMHEFLHALGFYHMQSAFDRDDYVKIQWDHIIEGTEHNFGKYDSAQVTHFNKTYDYESVMHYSARAFSKDGIETIVPLNKSFISVIGQRNVLSETDIIKLNTMYGCEKK